MEIDFVLHSALIILKRVDNGLRRLVLDSSAVKTASCICVKVAHKFSGNFLTKYHIKMHSVKQTIMCAF
jgi:hypothetical protein